MSAPPQVHAQSFAKAIRTDMDHSLVDDAGRAAMPEAAIARRSSSESAKEKLKFNRVYQQAATATVVNWRSGGEEHG